MIKQIIEILHEVEADTENIRIAKGKYKLPETIKEGYKVFRQELKWKLKSVNNG